MKPGCLKVGGIGCGGVIVLLIAMSFCGNLLRSPEQRAADKAEQAEEETLMRARVAVRRYVTSQMKAPSTAEVTIREAGYGVDGKIRMVGHVDAQNSFGAMLRNEWIIELSQQGDEFKVDSFILE